jgi:glutamine amidotransferase
MPAGAAAAAPFRRGPRLFSHNGRLEGWPKAAEPLAARLPPGRLLGLDTLSDSGLLWALVDDLLDRGRDPGSALAEVVRLAREVSGGRFNFLLTDGSTVAATAAGDSLFWRVLPGDGQGSDGNGGVVVASEPYDDEGGWHEVPDGHLVVAAAAGVSLTPL